MEGGDGKGRDERRSEKGTLSGKKDREGGGGKVWRERDGEKENGRGSRGDGEGWRDRETG
jgi:hypothetical protein